MDADDVHGTVARVERGAVSGIDGAAIVLNGAAAWGEADPEPQAVARVRKRRSPAPREHGELSQRDVCLALVGLRCSYINCRENVRLTSDGGETNERLLFHGTGAIKPQARA